MKWFSTWYMVEEAHLADELPKSQMVKQLWQQGVPFPQDIFGHLGFPQVSKETPFPKEASSQMKHTPSKWSSVGVPFLHIFFSLFLTLSSFYSTTLAVRSILWRNLIHFSPSHRIQQVCTKKDRKTNRPMSFFFFTSLFFSKLLPYQCMRSRSF